MNKRGQATQVLIMEWCLQANRFGATKATAHDCARFAGVTPQHANRVLKGLWLEGRVAFKWEQHRKGQYKRVWIPIGKIPQGVIGWHTIYNTPVQQTLNLEWGKQ